jgi:hypothetical protein
MQHGPSILVASIIESYFTICNREKGWALPVKLGLAARHASKNSWKEASMPFAKELGEVAGACRYDFMPDWLIMMHQYTTHLATGPGSSAPINRLFAFVESQRHGIIDDQAENEALSL